MLVIGLLVGLVGSFACATLQAAADSAKSATYLASFGLLVIAGPAQALACGAGIALLLFRGEEWRRLGLYGRVGSALLLALSVAIFALRVALSLRHLRFAPLEWLLRSLTYWRRQPMRWGGG